MSGLLGLGFCFTGIVGLGVVVVASAAVQAAVHLAERRTTSRSKRRGLLLGSTSVGLGALPLAGFATSFLEAQRAPVQWYGIAPYVGLAVVSIAVGIASIVIAARLPLERASHPPRG